MASGKTWNRRLALAGGAALAGAGALALRQPSESIPSKIPDARTFRRGNVAEPQSLDPTISTGIQDDGINGDLMMGLTTEDPQAHPIPGMAERWTTSPDGLTWTFFLREALWSDGVPVTAEDFVFAWRRLLDPATAAPYAYFLYVVKNAALINAGKMPLNVLGAYARDARRFEVRLEHPAPYMVEMLMHHSTYPLPRHVVTAKGREWARPGNHVGNGAFKLIRWRPNDHVLAEKNPKFFDAANVALERVFYYPTDDYGAALQRMRAGELDIQSRLPALRIDWIRANMPETTNDEPQLIIEYIQVNHARPPFGDIRVREAINLALNREAVAQRIRRVGDVPAYALVPPTTANYPKSAEFSFKSMPYPARLERARALMRAAGFNENNMLKTTYMIRSTTPGANRSVAAAIQQMWAQAFINVTILPTDFQVFLAQTRNHDFDIIEAGWVADFNDAATFLELLQTGGGNNDGQYSSLAFDGMLAAAQRDRNLVSRGQKLAAAEAIALKDHAIMPLYFTASTTLVWPYVKGWGNNGVEKHRSRWISIDQAARLKQFA
ncbi:MAG TPA: peptide ABC transporter substrate-binding protein [Rhizomicrobium sp.]|nr:peptide ABC transporter substrate-binding protein [Rhizomicrobium sp.]